MSQSKDPSPDELRRRLDELKLAYMRDHAEELVRAAAAGQWSHAQFLARLLEGEAALRQDHARARRIKEAGFPVLKTLEQFDFTGRKRGHSSIRQRPKPAILSAS
jgi:DNA replication protein DnaC